MKASLNETLTLKMLKGIEPDSIFDFGVYENPRARFVSGEKKLLKWVACRGTIYDWAVYMENPYIESFPSFDTFEQVQRLGDKVHDAKIIKELVPCDDEAFDMYRH